MKRFLALLVFPAVFSAQADEASIRKNLAEYYPGIAIQQINPAPVAGLYEVWASGKLFYVDEKADYILSGVLVDGRTKTNLTQKRMEELQAVKFDALPFDKAIRIVKGNGERRLAVFADPECPYCKQLEKELARVDNLTLYVFMYPLQEIHPQAVARAEAIWCSADRSQSWKAHMLDGKDPPPPDTKCENPVAELVALGNKLGVEGTPTLIFPNGKRKEGALPAAEIESLLKSGS